MNLLTFIKHFESFSPCVYVCPGGQRTIGYGHVLKPGEKLQTITRTKAEAILSNDLFEARYGVSRLITAPLKPYQWDTLTSFAFNVGTGALQASRLRLCVNEEQHDEVPQEFLRWVYAGGRKLKGLVRRRTLESLWYQNQLKGLSPEELSPEELSPKELSSEETSRIQAHLGGAT